MPAPWETLCVIRRTSKTPSTAGVQAAQRRLSGTVGLTHRHAEDPHWKVRQELIIVKQSWKPFHHHHCAYAKASAKPKTEFTMLQRRAPPKIYITQTSVQEPKSFNALASDSSENELNLDHPSKHWGFFPYCLGPKGFLDITPLNKAV